MRGIFLHRSVLVFFYSVLLVAPAFLTSCGGIDELSSEQKAQFTSALRELDYLQSVVTTAQTRAVSARKTPEADDDPRLQAIGNALENGIISGACAAKNEPFDSDSSQLLNHILAGTADKDAYFGITGEQCPLVITVELKFEEEDGIRTGKFLMDYRIKDDPLRKSADIVSLKLTGEIKRSRRIKEHLTETRLKTRLEGELMSQAHAKLELYYNWESEDKVAESQVRRSLDSKMGLVFEEFTGELRVAYKEDSAEQVSSLHYFLNDKELTQQELLQLASGTVLNSFPDPTSRRQVSVNEIETLDHCAGLQRGPTSGVRSELPVCIGMPSRSGVDLR